MNPIKITLITLGAWIALAIICVFSVEDISEKPFGVALDFFYLAPFVCIVAFIISSIFYRSWIKDHKIIAILFSILLIIWSLYIILYLWSLFI